MRRTVTTSILAVIAFTLIFGLAYPLAMTGVSQLVFPGKADGSKLTVNGRLVGSSLIGQDFGGEPALLPDRAPRRRNTRRTPRASATSAPTASKSAKRCAKTSPPTSSWRSPTTNR